MPGQITGGGGKMNPDIGPFPTLNIQESVSSGPPPPGFFYLRPDATSYFLRPDATSKFERP